MLETEVVEGPAARVTCEETVEAIQKMRSGKANEPLKVSVEMIVASDEIGIKVMMDLCRRKLNCRRKPDEWKISVNVPIFKGKDDLMRCGSYKRVKLLKHAMIIVERVLEANTNTDQFK